MKSCNSVKKCIVFWIVCVLCELLCVGTEQGHGEPSQQGGQHKAPPTEKLFRDEELVNLIDPILAVDDTNNDGYIDYPEFVRAQQKSAAAHPPKK